MVEDDIFTAQGNKISNSQVKSSIHSLITLERTQKLDLLAHLITNLRQSLIVCGPVGIGKTTLLNVLIERALQEWRCYYIQDSRQLSFESVQEQLSHFIKKNQAEINAPDLAGCLTQLARRNQKLVLIIDDAGLLVPGLIDTLNRFSLAYPALRIIFALTQDDLYVKGSSDRTVEDCHFIELPPLSEKQCGEFLRNLSGKPGAIVSYHAIDDNMIAHLYQETHGIPGRIMADLPNLSNYGQVRAVKWTPAILLVLIVMVGLAYWAWEEEILVQQPTAVEPPLTHKGPVMKRSELNPPKIQRESQPVASTEPEVLAETDNTGGLSETAVGEAASDSGALQKLSPGIAKPPAAIETEAVDSQAAIAEPAAATERATPEASAPSSVQVDGDQVQEQTNSVKPDSAAFVESPKPGVEPHEVVAVEKTVEPELLGKPVSETDDRQWLYKQPSKNYTLQLIALSSRQSLMALMNKYSSLQQHFKYIKTISNRKEKYILLYGSFNSYASAGSTMQKLPKEFRKSWIRRFKVLQNDVRNAE